LAIVFNLDADHNLAARGIQFITYVLMNLFENNFCTE
jgi:hypothetical protein